MSEEAFPLQWPTGWPRTKGHGNRWAPYKVSADKARRDLLHNLHLMGGINCIISSNVPLRRDGMPYADAAQKRIDDPGVAVYFQRKVGGERQVIACDKWNRPESNIRAIGLCVEALRAIARSGASELLDRAFTGFKALPASPEVEWWTVLGVPRNASAAEIKSAYRKLALRHHPDVSDRDENLWHRVQTAYEQAQYTGFVA
jgi:ribosomal protein S14